MTLRTLPLAVLLIISGTADLFANQSLSRRIINRVLFQLDRTATGRRLNALRAPHRLQVHFDYSNPARLHYIEYPAKGNGGLFALRFHSYLRPAWPQYNSWVFVKGLTHFEAYTVFKRPGAEMIPATLLEVDQLAFLRAMRHWYELGAPLGKDFASDERYRGARNLALRMRAGIDALYLQWSTDIAAFLNEVGKRRAALGQATQTVAEYRAESGRTPAEIQAVDAVGAWVRRELKAEGAYWRGGRAAGFPRAAARDNKVHGSLLRASAAFSELAALAGR